MLGDNDAAPGFEENWYQQRREKIKFIIRLCFGLICLAIGIGGFFLVKELYK